MRLYVWAQCVVQTPLGIMDKHSTTFLQPADSHLQNTPNLKALDQGLWTRVKMSLEEWPKLEELLTLTLHRKGDI